MILKDYAKGCKTLSEVKEQIIKGLTKGNVFRWHFEPKHIEEANIAAAKKRAEEKAIQLIREQIATLPKRIKIDIEY